MQQILISQCWYSDLGTESDLMQPTGELHFIEAPVLIERVVAVDSQDPSRLLLQINPSGKPDG